MSVVGPEPQDEHAPIRPDGATPHGVGRWRSAVITLSFATIGAALSVLCVHAVQPLLRAPALAPSNRFIFAALLVAWFFFFLLLPHLGRRAWRGAQDPVPRASRLAFALPPLLGSSLVLGALFDPVVWDFVTTYEPDQVFALYGLALLTTLVAALLVWASQHLARRLPVLTDRGWPIYLGTAVIATAAALPLPLPFQPTDGDASPFEAKAVAGLRVVLFGVDGADWRTIDALVAQGELPAFARLRRDGVTAPLPTIPGDFSPIIWTTVATGRPPSVHGVLGFYDLYLPQLDLRIPRVLINPLNPMLRSFAIKKEISYVDWLARPHWSVLSDLGRSMLLVNWFFTAPVEPIRGVMISDRDRFYEYLCGVRDSQSRDAPVDWVPPDLGRGASGKRLAKACWETPDIKTLLSILQLSPTTGLSFYQRQIRSARVFTTLLEAGSWDVAIYLTRLVDGVSHTYSQLVFGAETGGVYPLKVSEENRSKVWQSVVLAYRDVDSTLARVFETLDEQSVLIVVSDHGWDYDGAHHNRSPDGIIAMFGTPLDPQARFAVAPSLYDVTPTVVALAGGPLSREFEGRALSEILANPPEPRWVDTYGEHRPEGSADFDPDENARHLRELRALGYIEQSVE